jgi:hypothetical protein
VRALAGLTLLGAAAVAGCDQGTLNLSLADAPVDDADRVVLQVTGVVLENGNGALESFEFSPAKSIDLLAQSEGASAALLEAVSLPDGDYVAVRLRLRADGSGDDSFVEVGTDRRALLLPAANASRLRVADAFTVEPGEELSLTLDFDLRKSVLARATAGDPHELKPALRLVEDARTGSITGTVSAALAGASGCRPAVYVYRGRDVVPDDEGSATPPLASGRVRASGSAFRYVVAWLPAGGYTAAFTCEAAADDPQTDEATAFSGSKNATVEAGQGATVDFP